MPSSVRNKGFDSFQQDFALSPELPLPVLPSRTRLGHRFPETLSLFDLALSV